MKIPLVGRASELNCGAPDGFLHCPPVLQTAATFPTLPPSLYAVIGTWFEADIIEATVRNCFANGCEKVFIVDNDSPDDTCRIAEKAGATIAQVYRTDYYDDDLRLRLMNKVMSDVAAKAKLPALWWLSLDADEFPCGACGSRLIDYLAGLDRSVNCVGANAIDLYPTTPPHYVTGRHPADCMTHGMMRRGWNWCCDHHHWKHPLLRQDSGIFTLAQGRGSHQPYRRADCRLPVIEPENEILMFHAPLRTKEAAFARLSALCEKQESLGGFYRSIGDDHHTGANGAIKRWRSLEHVYAGRWEEVEMAHSQAYGRDMKGIALYPWGRLAPGLRSFPRW